MNNEIDKETIFNSNNTVFVFGDNLIHRGFGGQATIARSFVRSGKSIGIPTKRLPSTDESAFFSDRPDEINAIQDVIKQIKRLRSTGKKIVLFPMIGEGFVCLHSKSPYCYGLIRELYQEFGELQNSIKKKSNNVKYRVVPGFEDYQVGSDGSVWSLKHEKRKKLKPSIRSDYYIVKLCKNGKERCFLVHRLIAIAFLHNPENKPEVNHDDGNRKNNNVGNLVWSTSSENCLHSYHVLKNKAAYGENNGMSKLTEKQVIEMRKDRRNGMSWNKLAKKYGVSPGTVRPACNGTHWKHLKDDLNQ